MNFKHLTLALLFACSSAYAADAPKNSATPAQDGPSNAPLVSRDMNEPDFNTLGFGELQQHDPDEDGLMTRQDYRAWMFDGMDRAKKGFFTALDAVIYYTGFKKVPALRQYRKPFSFSFKYLDTDKDGIATRKEYAAFAVALTRAADANGDGKVTRAEFNALRKKMFNLEDVDQNGGISLAEYLELVPRKTKADEKKTPASGKHSAKKPAASGKAK